MPRNPTAISRPLALALIAATFAGASVAQQPAAPKGGAAVVGEPGKAVAARAVEVSARVVGIDKATRTLTLKGPKGDVFDIVAGDDVKNFDQIKSGDAVVARYAQALMLELHKTRSAAGGVTTADDAVKAAPGERPAVAGARQLTAIADVVAVDPRASTVTLKGPKGNLVTLNVQNPEQFKVIQKGDQVEVTYTEALALSVEPAPKAKTK